jgi:hypothetical protein
MKTEYTIYFKTGKELKVSKEIAEILAKPKDDGRHIFSYWDEEKDLICLVNLLEVTHIA